MSPLVMILFLQYEYRTTIAHQYSTGDSTVQYNRALRAGAVPVFTSRRVLKRGVRGGFPPWLGRGGV